MGSGSGLLVTVAVSAEVLGGAGKAEGRYVEGLYGQRRGRGRRYEGRRGEDVEADGASLVGRLKTLLVLLPFGETARRSSPCRCGASTLPTNRHQIGEQKFGQTTRRCQVQGEVNARQLQY